MNRLSPLLRAKVRAPEPPQHFVRRSRLHDLLDDVVTAAPVTLVVAPAGAGKTSLLAGWTAEATLPIAWLSLDESDRDGTQFWLGMTAALDTIAPGAPDHARSMLRRSGQPLAQVVVQLLDDLDAPGRDTSVLVIDDLYLAAGGATDSLTTFIRHLPQWLHVVIASRVEPHLPLDRMRARGQLSEVRFGELRFSDDEANTMLRRLVATLTPDELDTAVEHAAGWAAGLQMVALSARASRARGDETTWMVRSDLLVGDYVWHEVLAEVDDELIETLLASSITERVNPSLAETLTGQSGAGKLLATGETRGLFVTRVGADGWYEVHSLVRAALRAELDRRSPTRVVDLHARAAGWFERAGEVPHALEHWLAAGRPREALRLLASKHADLYDNGREAIIRRTVDAIPAIVMSADFDAILEAAWCHLLIDRQRLVEKIAEATWWADHFAVDADRRSRLLVLQSIAATVAGDWVRGAELARGALDDLASGWASDPLGRFAWNMVARDIALSERWDDDSVEVRDAEHALNQDPERLLAFEGTRAVGLALAGRPVDALRMAAGIRSAVATANMSILRTEVALAEALAHRELGDDHRSVTELHALAENGVAPMTYVTALAGIELVESHMARGDANAATAEFDMLQEVVPRDLPGSGGQDWLARCGARLATATGRLEDAQRWVVQISDPFWHAVCAARVCFAAGDPAGVLAALEPAEPRCPRHRVIRDLLCARAAWDRDGTDGPLTTALALASSHSMLRTVAAELVDSPEMLERAAWSVSPEWTDRLRRVSVAGTGAGASGSRSRGALDTLTERERDVLRFLPSRLTLREIAAELYISLNTLKFHLKIIYGKLGVNSRSEAADAARRMSAIHINHHDA
jgi:LuxR family maltose regulon positive regulatory protein